MGERVRLDKALVASGRFPSRARAQAAIAAGRVAVDGRVVADPSARVAAGARIEAGPDPVGYVSRGGLKLEAALDRFGVEARGRVCLDVGAGAGGFTECLLRRGARLVHAVDVGHGQLHAALRQEPRVRSREGTDVRDLSPGDLQPPPDLAVIDCSFIGLGHVLPSTAALLAPRGEVVALVKPQFEVGRGAVGKGGVVRDPARRLAAVQRVAAEAAAAGWTVDGPWESPVPGGDGNVEFFLHLRRRWEAGR